MNDKNKSLHPTASQFDKFLIVQGQEMEVRMKEMELHQQNNANAHEYSLKALDANKEDRAAMRTHEAEIVKYSYFFYGGIIIFLIFLVCFALYLNKDQIVMELLKAILFFGSGGVGGYAYAKSKKEKDYQE